MGRKYRPYDPLQHRRRKLTIYRTMQGHPPFVDARPAQYHIAYLRTRLTNLEIARRCGIVNGRDVPEGTIQRHTDWFRKDFPAQMRPELSAAILRIRFGADDLTRDERRRGAVRVLSGLMSLGFNTYVIGDALGLKPAAHGSPNSLPNVLTGRYVPGPEMYAKLLHVAEKLETVNPLDLGMTQKGVTSVRTRMRLRGAAPVTAWDYDTVHLPDSIPDWTGECGSLAGWRIHKRDDIPMCEACRVVKKEYEKERRRGKQEAA
jgi:hypothetical protein